MKNQPPCIEWADKIGLRHEDLSSQELTALNEHLQTCEYCKNALDDYNYLTARVHSLPLPIVKPLPRLPLYEEVDTYEMDEEVDEMGEMDENRARNHYSNVRHKPIIQSLVPLVACLVFILLVFHFWPYLSASHPSSGVPIGKTIATYHGHSGLVHTLAWSGDKETVASVGDDDTVRVWSIKNAKTLLAAPAGSPSAVTLSPDGTEVAFVKPDQADTFVIADIKSGKGLSEYQDAGTSITLLAWSPDGQKIVAADDEGTVQIWRIGQKDSIFTRVYNSVSALAWSPDSGRLVLGSFQNEVQVWNAANGDVITRYTGHTGSVSGVTWSPDGTHIASASIDKTVRVWDARNGKTLFVYKGHTALVLTVAWSPDGTRIASGDGDGTVQIWDAITGNPLYVYTGHTSSVSSVVWSADGKYIASCSEETIKVWSAS